MPYSLGLTLYNLAIRPVWPGPARPDRPRGQLVWLHAPSEDLTPVMAELARHLIEDDGVSVVLTAPVPPPAASGAIHQPAPPDHPRDVQAFLDHWRPDLVVFSDGELRPAMIHECALRKLPLLMVSGRAPHLPPRREGWYPGLIKSAVQAFSQILVLDDTAARAFRKSGAEPRQVRLSGRMEEASAALPYVESDRSALARLMATRPIWLAADVAPDEMPHVIAAHRQALQLAHRLLLILVPQDAASAPALVEKLEVEEDWRVAFRKTEQDPDAEIEVFVADASEYGLWYRLAPVTFLGGSLEGAGCARNPMEPAALGSAVLYGPRPGAFGPTFARLGAARAARMVASGGDLAEALGDLLSPDRAARQAHAAWTIASEGADVTDTVMSLIRAIMDGAPPTVGRP
jgi:3-deoxy-D-manno-octulosonic-acid transferase